jgi:hypothetical protein
MNSYVSGILSSLTALIVSVLSAYAAFVVIYGKADLRKLAGGAGHYAFRNGRALRCKPLPRVADRGVCFPWATSRSAG